MFVHTRFSDVFCVRRNSSLNDPDDARDAMRWTVLKHLRGICRGGSFLAVPSEHGHGKYLCTAS